MQRNLVEVRHAEQILPEELWELILKKITNAKVLWKLSLTSQLFQNIILKPSKNAWLFDKLLPLLFEYMDGKSILKCRTVCKCWRDRVDDFFENHAALQPHSDKSHNPRKPIWMCPMLEKNIGQYHVQADEHGSIPTLVLMTTHPRNPFIGRKLTVTISIEADMLTNSNTNVINSQEGSRNWHENQFFERLLSNFEELGAHLWHLAISVVINGCSSKSKKTVRDIVNQFLLVSFLKRFPNLRTLQIHVDDGEGKSKSCLRDSKECPSFPHLVQLDLSSATESNQPAILCSELLPRYHLQLQCLRIPSSKILRFPDFVNLEWPNLTELDIGGILDESQARTDLEQLLRLKAPNLKKLLLCPDCLESSNYDDLVEVLTKLPSTMPYLNVIRLRVNMSAAVWTEGLQTISTKLLAPLSLTTLELEIVGSFPVMYTQALLMRFRLIQYLNVWFRSVTNPSDVSGVHNFFTRKNKSHEFVVWTSMPRLEVLTLDDKLFTREQFKVFFAERAQPSQDTWLSCMD